MNSRMITQICTGIGAIWLLGACLTSQAQQPANTTSAPSQSNTPQASKSGKKAAVDKEETLAKYRVSVEVARDRATLMHDIYESTLHSMHRHYFRRERAILPARAMEDIFSEMEGNSKADARWISVNTKAMSINHEPESEFEKLAAKEIDAGKEHVELVENGYYHRATAIPLGAGCISCHNGLLAPPPNSPRFAGLVISIPIQQEPVKQE